MCTSLGVFAQGWDYFSCNWQWAASVLYNRDTSADRAAGMGMTDGKFTNQPGIVPLFHHENRLVKSYERNCHEEKYWAENEGEKGLQAYRMKFFQSYSTALYKLFTQWWVCLGLYQENLQL